MKERFARCPRCHKTVGVRESGALRYHLGGIGTTFCPEGGLMVAPRAFLDDSEVPVSPTHVHKFKCWCGEVRP